MACDELCGFAHNGWHDTACPDSDDSKSGGGYPPTHPDEDAELARARCWLWPDRTIGKKESRALREEHNGLVNRGARLEDLLRQALVFVEDDLASPDFKPGTVKKLAAEIRSMIE